MADDGVCSVLILSQELLGSGKSNLIDVFFYVFGIHAYALVRNRESAGLFVDFHLHVHFAKLALVFSER